MAERFEDLIVWQKARVLARAIYDASRQTGLARDQDLARQMRRAAVSIMSNIAEGVERSGVNELPHFLSLAKGSCAEVRSHLYLASDVCYLEPEQFQQLLAQTNEVGRLLSGLRASCLAKKSREAESRV